MVVTVVVLRNSARGAAVPIEPGAHLFLLASQVTYMHAHTTVASEYMCNKVGSGGVLR